METSKNQPVQKPKKHKKIKIVLSVIIILFVLLAFAVLIIVPAYVSSKAGNQTILAKINNSVDGTTDFSSLNMSWFKGIRLSDFAYDDDLGQISVRIKHISTMPKYFSILTGRPVLGKTVLDEPYVAIDLSSRPEKTEITEEAPEENSGTVPAIPISQINLEINNGDLKVTGNQSNTAHLTNINSKIDFQGYDKTNQFAADMRFADDAGMSTPLNLQGQINPKKVTGNLTVEVNELELSKLAPLFDLADIQLDSQGTLSTDIETSFEDSKLQNLTGTMTGSNINVGGPALKGDRFRTSKLNLDVQMVQQNDLINIDKLILLTDWAQLNAQGKVPTDIKSLSQFLQPNADYGLDASVNVDLPAVANQMPNTLNLEPGTEITSGQLTGKITRTSQADQAQIQADFQITNLAGTVDQQRVALTQPIVAQALISSDQSIVNFETLKVTSSFASVNFSGTSEQLDYQLDADLQKMQTELGSFIDLGGYKTRGSVTSAGQIAASENAINITGDSTIQNLAVTTPQGQTASEPQAQITMNLDLNRRTSGITINSLDGTAALGNFNIADGYLPAKDDSKAMSLPVTAKVDLAKIRPFAMLSSAYPEKLNMSGIATTNLNISKQNQTAKLSSRTTRIENFTYSTPDTQPVNLGLVIASFDVTAAPEQTIATFDVSSPDIKLKGNFNSEQTGQQKNLTAKADLSYDWKAITTMLSAFMSDDLLIEGQNKTNIELSTTYPADQPDKLLANMTTKPIRITFDRAEYLGFKVSQPSQLAVQFDKGLMQIPNFSATVNEGTFRFGGNANFNNDKVLLTLSEPMQILKDVKVDKEITLKLLQYIFPILSDTQKISGLASFDCRTMEIPVRNADKKDLTVDGTFAVKDMTLQSSIFDAIQKYFGKQGQYDKMEILPTIITAKDGMVRYDNMQLNAGNTPFNSVGRINLMNKSIKGSLIVTPYTTGKTITVGQEDTPGRIKVPFKGSYDSPELDFSGLIQQNIGNILEGAVKDGKIDMQKIEDIFK